MDSKWSLGFQFQNDCVEELLLATVATKCFLFPRET